MVNDNLDDEDILAIIRILKKGGLDDEELTHGLIYYLTQRYPGAEISNLMFWSKPSLTPEEILAIAKKDHKIYL